MLVVGLLTMGADNRYGKLIEQLGERNFLQVKIDPAWNFAGKDVVKEELGISDGTDAYFSFCTIARRDPDNGTAPCPDCERFRGHRFVNFNGKPMRLKSGQPEPMPTCTEATTVTHQTGSGVPHVDPITWLKATALSGPHGTTASHPWAGMQYPVSYP
jgi:hypothetical protein